MPEGKSPAKKRPRRSLSSSRSNAEAARSIVLCFRNAPPARLACPVCSQLVRRYDLNQHLDKCAGGDGATRGLGPGGPADALVSAADSTHVAVEDVTAEKRSPSKTNLTPSRGDPAKASGEARTSPYFKSQGDLQREAQGAPPPRQVEVIPLGSLSSKLSRRHAKATRSVYEPEDVGGHSQRRALAPAARAAGNGAERADEDRDLSSSQKENLFAGASPQEQSGPEHAVEGATMTMTTAGSLKAPQERGRAALTPAPSENAAGPSSPGLTLGTRFQATSEDSPAEQELGEGDGPGVEGGEAGSCGEGHTSVDTQAGTQASSEGEATSHSCRQDASTCSSIPEPRPGPDSGVRAEVAGGAALQQASSCGAAGMASPGHPYYLRSFLLVLDAVFGDEDDRKLFDEDERGIVTKFYQLSARGKTGTPSLPRWERLFGGTLTASDVEQIRCLRRFNYPDHRPGRSAGGLCYTHTAALPRCPCVSNVRVARRCCLCTCFSPGRGSHPAWAHVFGWALAAFMGALVGVLGGSVLPLMKKRGQFPQRKCQFLCVSQRIIHSL